MNQLHFLGKCVVFKSGIAGKEDSLTEHQALLKRLDSFRPLC